MTIFNLVTKDEKIEEEHKKDLIEVIENYKKMIESGEIKEFVISSINSDDEIVITACCKDAVTGVGLYEMGKQILIMQEM